MFTIVPLLATHPRGAWRVSPLGGITNRSYRLQAAEMDLVLRWPGASASRYLDRSAEPGNATAVASLGIAPPVLAADPDAGWYITAYATGAEALQGAAFADPATLTAALDLLSRLHCSGIVFPFRQGLFQAVDLYLDLAPTPSMQQMRRALEPVRLALLRNPMPLAPCHIDPNPANFLRCADGRLLLIDWEFAAMEEPLWDLAAVAMETGLGDATEHALIESRIGAEQLPRFELYKTALNLVAASWCEAEIVAGNDSAELTALRDHRLRRLERRLADPRHAIWLKRA